MPKSVTVIVPALNEAANLRALVEALLAEIGPRAAFLEILIFDDASTDATGRIADELAAEDPRVRAVHNPRRLNIGGIYKAGLRAARGEHVFLAPGDGEIRVDEVARALPFVERADLVVFHVTNPWVRPWARRLLSRLYVGVVNAAFGTRFRYTNGPNIVRADTLRSVDIRTDGFSYQTEVLVKAVRSGADWVEVGIELRPREFGASKAISWRNFRAVAGALARLWWDVRVVERRRYRAPGLRLGRF